MAKFLRLHPSKGNPAYVVFINVEFIVLYSPTTVTICGGPEDDFKDEEVEATKVLISLPHPDGAPVDRTYTVSETAEEITQMLRGEL